MNVLTNTETLLYFLLIVCISFYLRIYVFHYFKVLLVFVCLYSFYSFLFQF